jgi:6-phosphogluconolactonase
MGGNASEPDAGEPAPTSSFVYVSGYASPISTLVLDHATGTLTPMSSVETGVGGEPTFIAFSPNKRFAYAIDEQLNGPLARMIAYAIDGANGALSEINRRDVGTSVNAHVGIHPSGDWVLSANYGGGSVTVFPVRDDGGLDPAMDPVPAGGQAHQIVFDQTGSILFVPCLTSSHIAVYDFAAGVLTPRNPATIPIDGGPRHMAFTPDQRFVYVLTQGESTISAFEYDASTAGFTPLETIPSTPEGSLSAHIEVHKSGKFLYTSNRQDDSIAIFTIDEVTGRLTNVGYQREMLTFPRFFGIDPTGELMIIASQDTAQILVHRIDQQTGLLSVIGPPLNVPPMPTFVGLLAIQ